MGWNDRNDMVFNEFGGNADRYIEHIFDWADGSRKSVLETPVDPMRHPVETEEK